ncbi:BamA/TamA family outer membrane protein [bacterium SCSIO 12741]|nr:BamA/TamA family outer membrane protein [bacterium SCSIO 12741]
MKAKFLFMIGLSLMLALPGKAQFGLGGGGGAAKRDTSIQKLRVTGFPLIQYDRTQDLIFGAIGMLMFPMQKSDTLSPTSMAGVGIIGTQRESWGALGFSKLYMKEDRWRATLAAGYFSFNYQFYWDPVPNYGQFIQYNSGFVFAYGQVLRRINSYLLFGTHLTYMKANTTLYVLEQNVPRPVTYMNNTGLDLDLDTRNDVYYPDEGIFLESSWEWAPEWLENTQSYHKFNLSVNHYHRLKKWWVQASRFTSAFGIGEIPFEAQEILGGTDIRGYSQGAQRGDQLFSIQTESRFQVLPRWFLIAFAGVGTTANEAKDYNWDNLWPGAGGGFRFTVIPSEMMNIGIDAAAGRGDWSLQFTIGESF